MLLDVLHVDIDIQIDVGCPMGAWMFKSTWLSRMCTWLSKSMFDFQNGTWFPKSMFDFPDGNMVFQIDVGCQFTHWVQTMGSNMMRCTSLVKY